MDKVTYTYLFVYLKAKSSIETCNDDDQDDNAAHDFNKIRIYIIYTASTYRFMPLSWWFHGRNIPL